MSRRTLNLALLVLLCLLSAPAAALAEALTDVSSPGNLVDRFADRRDMYSAGYEVQFARAVALDNPQQQTVAPSVGTITSSYDHTAAAAGVSSQPYLADTRVRRALLATNLTTDAEGELDGYDRTLSAYGCQSADGQQINVCVRFDNGQPLRLPVSVRPGSTLAIAVGAVGTDGARGIVAGYVTTDGRAWVRLIRVVPGRRNGTPATQLQDTGRAAVVYAPDVAYDAQGAAGDGTDIQLTVADSTIDGTLRIGVAAGARKRTGADEGLWRIMLLDGNLAVTNAEAVPTRITEAPRMLSVHTKAARVGTARPAFDTVLAMFTHTGSSGPMLTAVTAIAGGRLRFEGGLGLDAVDSGNPQAVVVDDTSGDLTQDVYVAGTYGVDGEPYVGVWRVAVGLFTLVGEERIYTQAQGGPTGIANAGRDGGFRLAAADTRSLVELSADGTEYRCMTHRGCQSPIPDADNPGNATQMAILVASEDTGSADGHTYGMWTLTPDVRQGRAFLTPNKVEGFTAMTAVDVRPEIVAGAYAGRYRIGTPTYHVFSRQQPLIVLNAPPTHLDVWDETTYDVNTCHFANYASNECQSYSQYSETADLSNSFTHEAKEAWGVSVGVEAKVSAYGAYVEAAVEGSVGGETIATGAQTQTINVETNVKAQDDDQVYVADTRNDILEYPIIGPDGESLGEMAYMLPTVTSHRWVSANGPYARGYTPDHQTGHLLSYAAEPTAEYSRNIFNQFGYGAFGSVNFELTRNSSFEYAVSRETIASAGRTDTFNWGVSASAKVGYEGEFGPVGVEASVSVKGNYDNAMTEGMSSTVGSRLSLTSKLGGITSSLGRVGFLVRPYVYYRSDGPLVVDYAVTPDVADDGADTFWTSRYGRRPDPTFNLPHLLDPARQIVNATQAERTQTKSITFAPGSCAAPVRPADFRYPRPGDTVCLKAQVENYSLKNLTTPIDVSFYLGDPDYGGTLIGSTQIAGLVARGSVAQREQQVVQVDWTVPPGLRGRTARIFAVLDRDHQVTEVHEDNNKGWAGIRVYGSAQGARALTGIPVSGDGRSSTITIDVPDDQPAGTTYRVYAYPENTAGLGDTPPQELQVYNAGPFAPGSSHDVELDLRMLADSDLYVLAVRAVGPDGTVQPISYPTEPVGVTAGSPTRPVFLTARPTDGRVLLNWFAPVSEGNEPITNYTVRIYSESGRLLRAQPTVGTAPVFNADGLTNGVPYRFTVTATNGWGESLESETAGPVTPLGAPTAPGRPAAQALAGGRARLSWTPPDQNGGYAVTGYDVAVSPGGAVLPATGTTVEVPDLEPGTPYTFTVTARTSFGTSPRSAESSEIVAYDVPSAPFAVSAAADGDAVEVNWDEADGRGRPVSSYRVTVGTRTQSVSGTARSLRIGSLAPGTYTPSVVAVNAAGPGEAGQADAVSVLGPPTAITAVAGNGTATVSWQAAPGDDGFVVRSIPGDIRVTTGAGARQVTISGLANGTSYAFVVALIGGRDSEPSNAVTPSAPSTPGEPSTPSEPVRVGAPAGTASPPVLALPAGTIHVAPGSTIPLIDPHALNSCSIDGAPAVPCPLTVPTRGLADGVHTVVVTRPGAAPQTATFLVDATPPSASLGPLGPHTRLAVVRQTVRASDAGSGVTRVQVRLRRAKLTGNWGPWQMRNLPVDSTRAEIVLARGTTACVSVRAIDRAGNVSAWSTPRCVARVADDRTLKATPGAFLRTTAERAYGGTLTEARREGGTLAVTVGPATGLSVLAHRVAGPARVAVSVGGRRVATLDAAALRKPSTVIALRRPASGRLTLRVLAGRVSIDGVAVTRAS